MRLPERRAPPGRAAHPTSCCARPGRKESRIGYRRSHKSRRITMSRSRWFSSVALGFLDIAGGNGFAAGVPPAEPARMYLHKDWRVQSSCQVKAMGEEISTLGFDARSWHRADIPATVVAALVADGTYPDPDYGTNLQSLPGMNYSKRSYFAIQDMPSGSPVSCSSWYRTEVRPSLVHQA